MTDNALKEIEGLDDPKPIEIEVGGAPNKDGAENGKDRKAETDAGKPPQAEDENVLALRRSLAAERRSREAAEARARDAEARRVALEAQTVEGQLRLTTNSLEAAQAAKARAVADFKSAMANSDHGAAAEAQAAIADAQYQVSSLTRGKEEIERRAAEERQAREQRRPPQDDPVEAMAAGLSAKAGDWIRNNPECVTDPRKMNRMLVAHDDALGDGIPADSPEYFAYIEKRLGIGHQDGGEAARSRETEQRQTTTRRPAPTDAPVARSAAGDGRGAGGQRVTLSPAERKFCSESGMKEEDYARHKLSLKAEGRLQ